MITEEQLYGTENSIFASIVFAIPELSTYHVSPDYGADINTDNLQQYMKDPKYGVKDYSDDKYPLVVCMTPKSRIVLDSELFFFNIFFITRSYVNDIDSETNTSRVNIYRDWSYMKEQALKFLSGYKAKLNEVIEYDTSGSLYRSIIGNLNAKDPIDIRRLSLFTVDNVAGVSINFTIPIAGIIC